ncbi:MAG TPA: hypothetical protein VN238_00950 [Solirubrobacteraceae bacterium]|nr:hypothetical protein [Solirubrobacteraceae bacterium]
MTLTFDDVIETLESLEGKVVGILVGHTEASEIGPKIAQSYVDLFGQVDRVSEGENGEVLMKLAKTDRAVPPSIVVFSRRQFIAALEEAGHMTVWQHAVAIQILLPSNA